MQTLMSQNATPTDATLGAAAVPAAIVEERPFLSPRELFGPQAESLRQPPVRTARLDSVDLLRGLVMVIMALDHTRDYFHNAGFLFDPTDLTKTNAALFLTRWITHFCAPVFVFLAGTGAYLSLARGKTKKDLSWFLVTRGLWLVVLEVTLIQLAWTFSLPTHGVLVQVIWALGCSMIVLAALIHLPLRAIAAIGAALIVGHNLLDRVRADSLGAFQLPWLVLHQQGMMHWGAPPPAGFTFFVVYPLIPWVGVMAVGYAFGPL